MPVLRARDAPPLGWWMARMRVSAAAYLSQISPELSREPSSTSSNSQSEKVWAIMLSTQRPSHSAALYTGTMMDMAGVSGI